MAPASGGRTRPGPMLLIGGGSGMSPLWSILPDHIASGEQRPVRFFYGARTRADLFYLDEIAAIAAKLTDFKFIPALSHAEADDELGGRKRLRPRGRAAPLARGGTERRDRRLCLRAAADDRRRAAGPADERRRARSHLFRQVYAGGAMTAFEVVAQENDHKGESNERTTEQSDSKSGSPSSPGPRGPRYFPVRTAASTITSSPRAARRRTTRT